MDIRELNYYINNNNNIFLYGCGKYGCAVASYMRDIKKNPTAFVITEKPSVKEFLGIPVYEFDKVYKNDDIAWIVCAKKSDDIEGNLISNMITNYHIVTEKEYLYIRKKVIEKNIELKQINKKKRCFIMATGNSLNMMDLSKIKNEDVFTCSYSPLIKNYEYVNPAFFVAPAFSNDMVGLNDFKIEYVNEGVKFIDKFVSSPTIVLDYSDYAYVKYSKLLKNKKVYYILQEYELEHNGKKMFDLTSNSYQISTATIMMIKVAMYMGYKEIILIGADLTLGNGVDFTHAYNIEDLCNYVGYDAIVKSCKLENIKKTSYLDYIFNVYKMYKQFRIIHDIARANDVQIINASVGGYLDEFERVNYNDLFY